MYRAALEALNEAHIRFLQAATEARGSGEDLRPSPEVVSIAHADDAVRWWLNQNDRSSEDRWRRRMSGQLLDILSMAEARFGPLRSEVETVDDLRWHLYTGGPKAGYSGYVERVGESAPEGHERIVYWLAADGAVQRPARPGFPPGGEAPPAGADTDRQRVIDRGFE